jgi:hypothetical protein
MFQTFSKKSKYELWWNSVHWEPSCSMQTDRLTEMMKLTVAFRNFATANKNSTFLAEYVCSAEIKISNSLFALYRIIWLFSATERNKVYCAVRDESLTFRHLASYIGDGHAPLPSRCCIIYIFFSTNISTEYFKHAAHSPFFSSKCLLFHNATFFGSCIIHILHTGCAKILM